MTTSESGSEKLHATKLIVSDNENPAVQLKPGMRLEVRSVSLVDSTLLKPERIGSRLCGGTSTCLAIVEIGADVINPAP